MDYEKVLDYTYPKLFTLVPRDQMLEMIEATFDNEEMSAQIDSIRVEKLYPMFVIGDGKYAKANYSMIITMHFKKVLPPDEDQQRLDQMLQTFSPIYGKENVSITDNKDLKIRTRTDMVAILDSFATEWSFLNMTKDDPLLEALLSKEILEKLDTYK
jgi:hypothetical protein